MSFDVPPEAYARFMGRYADPLAEVFVAFAEVAAIDPSPPFIDAIRVRFPDLDVRRGTAEELPYDTAAFDAALAQLVVHFMTDPVVGIRQMARVTRHGGVIAACVWDGPTGALAPFWDAVHLIDPEVEDEALLRRWSRTSRIRGSRTSGWRAVHRCRHRVGRLRDGVTASWGLCTGLARWSYGRPTVAG